MAATRLIALHVNKGKTVAQCLADRTDYSQNAAKTNDGEFISSYECDPKTADEEFLLSKRQYPHCAEIEAAAKSRMNTILPQLMKHYGVTERLKAANQLEWVRQMNACVAQAEEVIKDELIYS